jgi:hypothetical protein
MMFPETEGAGHSRPAKWLLSGNSLWCGGAVDCAQQCVCPILFDETVERPDVRSTLAGMAERSAHVARMDPTQPGALRRRQVDHSDVLFDELRDDACAFLG